MTVAIVAITRGGARLGAELAAALGQDVELHGAERWASGLGAAAKPFRGPLAEYLGGLFQRVDGLVMVLALGATVRLIAPLLSSKREDPAVVAVDESGRFAISVVGGHGAKANKLAERIADAIAATPVITTASESLGLPAIDLLGEELGWKLDASAATVTTVSAAAVNGEPIGVFQDACDPAWRRAAPEEWRRMANLDELAAWGGPGIVITDAALDHWAPYRDRWVVYRPPTLVLGVGCSSGVTAGEIEALARAALVEDGLCWDSLASVATIDQRLEEPGLRQFADQARLPLHGFSSEQLAAVSGMPSSSAQVARLVGAPGVCEPAAVLESGDGELVVAKRKSARATVAVARRPATAPAPAVGCLAVVGLGPGRLDLTAPLARRTLRLADVIIGYRGYLGPLMAEIPGGEYQAFELGREVERARAAIERARRGQRVALVSSGDAGVYGMAGLVFELLEGQDGAPCVEIIPGITAAHAAAALLGAPLMLDFAAINLSDLLVPWDAIERRLEAVAAADLVIALYNPASSRRREPLAQACDVLLRHRSRSTPVGLVREAYRPDQRVRIADLGDLPMDEVDMKTIIIVGNSSTVRLGDRLVTRRGYSRMKKDG